MTDQSTIARERALNCEAKKHAYRQTQDGVVVSFVLHPQDVPDGLATAPLGTRYVLAMVELSDDETPVDTKQRRKERAAASSATPAAPAAPETEPPPGRPKVSPDKRLVQQAAMLCEDIRFNKFLRERGWFVCNPAEAVRKICKVDSRSEILPGTAAGKKWEELMGDFEMWKSA